MENLPIRLVVVACLAMAAGVVAMRGGVVAPPAAVPCDAAGAIGGSGPACAALGAVADLAPTATAACAIGEEGTTARSAAVPAPGRFLVGRFASANFDRELIAAITANHPELGAPLPPCADREAVQLVQLGAVPFAVIARDLSARDRHAGLRATPIPDGIEPALWLVSNGRPSGAAADFVAFATSPAGRQLLARPPRQG
jgi:hypothetical protein